MRRLASEFVRFTTVGAAGLFVDIAVLYVAIELATLGYVAGRVVSFLAAATFTWTCNRSITFAGRGSAHRAGEWLRFLAANSVGGAINFAVYLLVVAGIGGPPGVAPQYDRLLPYVGAALGSLSGLLINFTLSRMFVFRQRVEAHERSVPSATPETFDASRPVVFVLAHQDDEIAFAPVIAHFRAQKTPLRVVFLTSGVAASDSAAQRNAESRRALATLGVPLTGIRFLGTALPIPDGQLVWQLSRAYRALVEDCRDIGEVGCLFTLAWEGGHPDHDAAHVLTMKLAVELGAEDRTWQVPFYRAAGLGPPFFTMFAPLTRNGPALRFPAARRGALLRARAVRHYPSQWRTFAGLGPAIFWHALVGTPATAQRVRVRRSIERPTTGALLYERRYGVSFEKFGESASAFLAGKPGETQR